MHLNTTQIGAIIGRSEATARRWLANGTMDAQHIQGLIYDISEQELERHTSGKVIQGYLSRIGQLESVVSGLERRIKALERTLSGLHTGEIEQQSPVPAPSAPPTGTIALAAFAELHQVNRRTLLDQLLNDENGLEHTAVPIPTRPGKFERLLTLEQQHAVVLWWTEQGKKYTPCSDCPH